MTASQVQSTALLKFTTEPTLPALPVPSKDHLLRDFAEKLQKAEAELKRQRERSSNAENTLENVREELAQVRRKSTEQIAQLTAEVMELQRIVGELQYRLNQSQETTE
jgi:carbonic anhydrase